MRVTFDRFSFDSERRELLQGTQPIHLGPKAFALLEILIGGSPRAFSKKELYERIWPDTFVDESNLPGLVNEVRAALGDRARKPRFIRTVHGFGYAFHGELKSDDRGAPAAFVVHRGRELPLREGVNTLGRDPSADVQIEDDTVSRKHAAITLHAESATIEDLASKNGTFIDGVQLHGSAALGERHAIVLGDASLVFRRWNAPGSTVTVSRSRRR